MTALASGSTVRGPLAIALFLVLALASGCSTWSEITPPKDGVAEAQDKATRLTLDDGTQHEVRGLRVEGDTLRYVEHSDSLGLAARRVLRYEKKEQSTVGTILLLAGIGLAFFLVGGVFKDSSGD